MDSYILSSQNTVRDYRKFIQKVLAEVEEGQDTPVVPTVRRKTVRVIECIPTAKKKIKTKDDIQSVIDYIKAELEKALNNNDEIDLD